MQPAQAAPATLGASSIAVAWAQLEGARLVTIAPVEITGVENQMKARPLIVPRTCLSHSSSQDGEAELPLPLLETRSYPAYVLLGSSSTMNASPQ
jgi:hypothetical protein